MHHYFMQIYMVDAWLPQYSNSRLCIPPHDDQILPRIGYDAKVIAHEENQAEMSYLLSSLILLSLVLGSFM